MTMPTGTMYQSFQGPTDTGLRMGPVEGYTQVSRVGEQVQNCFVDGVSAYPSILQPPELCASTHPLALSQQFHDRDSFPQYEYGTLADTFTDKEILGTGFKDDKGDVVKVDLSPFRTEDGLPKVIEYRPHFYEWATATVGMIAVARRQRSTFRNYVAAEAAAPVMVCAALKGPLDEVDWMFAGVVRSNCVRTSAEPKFDPTPPVARPFPVIFPRL